MRVLTVRQPWAWAILNAGKNIENRSRNIVGSYRGPVAIHAGMTADNDGIEECARLTGHSRDYVLDIAMDKPRGMNITVVTTAKTDEESRRLLQLLGFPVRQG